RCHRLLRVIADRLARAGFHVLRFDFFGTGDSDGDDGAGGVPQWMEDVRVADAEVSRLSGNSTTSWLGLRLGGSIAAATSVGAANAPHRLVLWDPVADGAAYVSELQAAHDAGVELLPTWDERKRQEIAATAGEMEILGFPMSKSLREQILRLSCSSLVSANTENLHIFCSKDSADLRKLKQHAVNSGAGVRLIPIETEIVWASNEAMNSAIVPAEALNGIVDALGGRG
ncbi:MAG: alpha/beta hydrolase, partial [Usitatibacteraceae bacterium]